MLAAAKRAHTKSVQHFHRIAFVHDALHHHRTVNTGHAFMGLRDVLPD